MKKILTQKKYPKKWGKVCKFLKDFFFFFFLRKSLPGLSCQATLLAFLPHTVCFPATPCKRHRKTKKTPIFMWSLERCKSFWFVEERQGKENAINLQLWQKVPQKQLNNFPVTLETEFTPQQTGKLPAITTLEKSTSLDKTSISVCCSSFNVIPVIHHEQYWIWNGILLPNPKDPEFYYQTRRV